MDITQQSKQLRLNFKETLDTPLSASSEMSIATEFSQRLTEQQQLLEMILERTNMWDAYKRVRKNDGAPGVDGMTVKQAGKYLKRHWLKIRAAILDGTHQPLPVRRKEIPKPDGGVRLLGIPAVVDRVIQQAIAQVLGYIWEPVFSEFSFGFRPGLSQHDAIVHAKSLIEEGYRNIVDLDLEKFFDRVNHDRLMSRLATRITDKRVLALIRRYLNSGILIGGLVSPTEEGVPQGGPLSPLLSNVVLDELDKELERRGLRFVRYADDCVIYVRSYRAAGRVKESISCFITKRLKLKVNEAKSAVSYPWWRKYLGFSFTSTRGNTRIRIHSKSFKRFKKRVHEITGRSRGRSLWQVIQELNDYVRGWWGYYRHTETYSFIRSLNYWIMRRLRALRWKQWKNYRTRIRELKKRGIKHDDALRAGCSRKGPWRMSRVKWVVMALPNAYFKSLGLYLLS
jgi:group II intron reverse transcriptase/maturase